jgi:fluoroquinolone transport system permease protein
LIKIIFHLARFDLRHIFRDFLLTVSLVAPFVMALLFRYAIPAMDRYLADKVSFSLMDYDPTMQLILVMTVPILLGILGSFIVLDEKDEGVLPTFSVTPITKKGYLLYRLLNPVLLATVLSFFAFFLAGYGKEFSLKTIVIILLTSLQAPVVTLFIVSIAKNKVDGLAVSKIASILLLIPLFLLFIEGPWKYIFSLIPAFWLTEFAYSLGWHIEYLLTCLVTLALSYFILLQRFLKTV